MQRPENPSAFPQHIAPAYVGDKSLHGMTLRDWLAGQALGGIGTWAPCPPEGWPVGQTNHTEMRRLRAEYCYAQADAMLAERAKVQS